MKHSLGAYKRVRARGDQYEMRLRYRQILKNGLLIAFCYEL
jgi:hypothetical protein